VKRNGQIISSFADTDFPFGSRWEDRVPAKKKLLKYKELASRLHGVQIPIFGVQWVPAEPERKVVRDVLTLLEDRRVVYNPAAWEMESQVTESVLRIRETLTDAIQRLGEDSKAVPAMRAMRAACREYLDASSHHYSHDLSIGLGRLRALFGLQIAFLAIQYGVDLEDDLASIIPPELAGLVDDGAGDVRPRLPRR
jgi:hypothetical protein